MFPFLNFISLLIIGISHQLEFKLFFVLIHPGEIYQVFKLWITFSIITSLILLGNHDFFPLTESFPALFCKGDWVDGVKCLLTTRGKHTNLLWAMQCLHMAHIFLKLQVLQFVLHWSFLSEYWLQYSEESAKGVYW